MSKLSLRVRTTLLAISVATAVPFRLVEGQACDFGSQLTSLDAGTSSLSVSNDGPALAMVNGISRYINDGAPEADAVTRLYVGFGGYAGTRLVMTGRPWLPFMLPGSLDATGLPAADSVDCAAADRMYAISTEDFALLDADGHATEEMANWPVSLGAPVVDGDGIPGNYNLTEGDRPALIGDQMVWWQMNDGGRLNLQRYGVETDRLGIEVTAMASVKKRNKSVDLTLFRYDVRYVGETVLDSAVIYLYGVPESGAWYGDEMRSDSAAGLGYVFTRGTDDVLGDKAPAVGFQVFRGPIVDDDGLDNNRNGVIDETGEELRPTMISGVNLKSIPPETSATFYRVRHGCFPGMVMIDGIGCARRDPTNPFHETASFWSPGDPTTVQAWDQELEPGGREVVISMGPFRWHPGTTKSVEFGVLWVRKDSHLESAYAIRGHARNLLLARDELFEPQVHAFEIEPEPVPDDYRVSKPYPNPTSHVITFELTMVAEQPVTIEIFDVLGRKVAERRENLGAGSDRVSFEVSRLTDGVYYYRQSIRNAVTSGSFVVSK